MHIPFEHTESLSFAKEIKDKYHVSDENVFCTGDIVDNNCLNFHEKDPDGFGAKLEMEKVKEHIADWAKVFPQLKISTGNHDRLPVRRAKAAGLPSIYIRNSLEVMGAPEGWKTAYQWQVTDDTILIHGDGFSGKYGYARACECLMGNVIMGHLHSTAGIYYTMTVKGLLWGMCPGSLTDDSAYAFDYAKFNPRRPINAIGIVREDGTPIIEVLK